MAALEAMAQGRHVGDRWARRSACPTSTRCCFPADRRRAFTKRDLIRYYVTIAPVMLPYLRERPLNLWRWPDGVTGKSFWQKQIPSYAPSGSSAGTTPRPARPSHTPTSLPTGSDDGLAGQPRDDRHAPVDVAHRRLSQPNLRPDRHRPRREDDVGRGGDAGAAVPGRARSPRGQRACPRSTGKRGIQIWIPIKPQLHVSRDAARGSRRFRGRSARPSRSSSAGSGPRPRAAVWRASTTRRTRSTRRSLHRTRCGRWSARPYRRRSAGTSWTIRSCARPVETSDPIFDRLPSAATCSLGRSKSSRNCRPLD